jgi:hypothetical protein
MEIQANPGHKVAIFQRDENGRLVCDRHKYLTSEGLFDGLLGEVTGPTATVAECDYYERLHVAKAISLVAKASPARAPRAPVSATKEG